MTAKPNASTDGKGAAPRAGCMNSLGYEEYERLSEGGRPVPVFRELPGDLRTPVSAFLSLASRAERAFLLESVLGGERLARYSFLGRDPVARLEVVGGKVRVFDETGEHETKDGLLGALRGRLGSQPAEIPGLPRFTGGAVGYLTWDAARLFERLPDHHGASQGTVASFAFYDSLVAFDHVRQRLVLIALAEAASRAAFERAQQRLDSFEEDLGWERRPAATRRAEPPPALPLGDGAAFREAVLAAKEHIARGDIFQVVLSRQHSVDCGIDPFTVYRALRMVNPSPYMYYLKEGEAAIAGASPEMLVRVEGRRVETRPIAGTRPRHDGRHDEAIARELLADEKERAEHLMLVDLGRNDLGRVCRFGSVQVPELMKVEHYSHVMHIVSSVTGELAEGRDALDALAATFPAGTLSGAPKIRAMQIIDELEPRARGLYGGALGYIDLRGNLDFCIAIRTLLLQGGPGDAPGGGGDRGRFRPGQRGARDRGQGAGALRGALGRGRSRMILLVDNYDSFTFNLYQYLGELGAEVKVVRNDAISVEDALAMRPDTDRDLAGAGHSGRGRDQHRAAAPRAGARARRLPRPPGARPGLRRQGRARAEADARQDLRDPPRRQDDLRRAAGRLHRDPLPLAGRGAGERPRLPGGLGLDGRRSRDGAAPQAAPARGRPVPPREHPHDRRQGPAPELPRPAARR